ncbi:ZmpA/ZmpB/ZmpC family metallo-endopeptidase-related protein, partial [Candidatus Auribacterota bacterium]
MKINDIIKRKYLLSISLILLSIFLSQPTVAQAATAVTNAQELQNIQNNLADDYYLANDINCSGIANFEPIGTAATPFTGTLNGNNYSISALTIDRSAENNVGLFGCVRGATIQNVSLLAIDITGNNTVGGLVGDSSQNSSVINS